MSAGVQVVAGELEPVEGNGLAHPVGPVGGKVRVHCAYTPRAHLLHRLGLGLRKQTEKRFKFVSLLIERMAAPGFFTISLFNEPNPAG